MVKGVLIDYGGTIDTNGLHWGAVLWDSYQKHQVNIDKALFSKAYAFGERSLAIHPIVKPEHSFHDTLVLKTEQQFKFLKENGYPTDDRLIESIASDCNAFAQQTVEAGKTGTYLAGTGIPAGTGFQFLREYPHGAGNIRDCPSV